MSLFVDLADPSVFGRCQHPDVMSDAMRGGLCKWPMKRVTWHQAVALTTLPPAQVQQAYVEAFAMWGAVCDLDPVYVDSPGMANIVARDGQGRRDDLDGPGGILAYSELPCNVAENAQIHQVIDAEEAWDYTMLRSCLAHELGHALGLPHLASGNLMQPFYSRSISEPQQGDIREMLARYGRRLAPPVTPPPPPPPAGVAALLVFRADGVITINGVDYVLTPKPKG